MKRLCVTGALHLDVVVETANFPQPDETVLGSSVNYVFGGKGGNQALAADKNGASVYFIGRLGTDLFGEKLLSTLNKSSVDVSQLQIDSGASGMSVAMIEKKGGDYGAIIVSGSNLRIDKTKLSIKGDTGILLIQNEVPESVNLRASQIAKEVGADVWLNAAPARKISDELFANLDVIIVNKVEAGYYKDILNSASASHLTKILTLGDKGVEIHYPDNAQRYFPAYKVKVLSTHGAGDMFIGALAANRLLQKSFEDSIRYAQGAAALMVSTKKNQIHKIEKKAVLAFLQNQLRNEKSF